MDAVEKPLPEPDEVSREFFAGLAQGELRLQRCDACKTWQLGEEICNHCAKRALNWTRASGRGVIYSFVVMHVGYHPAFKPPYNVAHVELDEGPRLLTTINGVKPSDLKVGQRVQIDFTMGPSTIPSFSLIEE
jgi:uncharacterized OB-fold protein